MNVSYKYAEPSRCLQQPGKTVLGLCPDLNRDEEVSFKGALKHPLVFRDAMLMLREIVISDARQKKKERVEFFDWLNREIEMRMQLREGYISGMREQIQNQINDSRDEMARLDGEIKKLMRVSQRMRKELDKHDVWKDFYILERKFWQFLRERDQSLWFVLDPVITVHPDQVTFEAFSIDESIYGCLSVNMDEFKLASEPKLGTTNIDFSAKLAKEMERFRTYTNVELSINPGGFTVDTGQSPEYMEKKIDLPETWIKGFNQVSSAANLNGISVELAPVDIYDICSFLRKHKEKKSPRYMKWILAKGKPVRIIFEPYGTELVLNAVYNGEKDREEKIWGRRRWLVTERLLPIAKSFTIKLLGFGMPQFITADIGNMKMTIGLSSWSSNDWVKGTAFNVMSGFIGDKGYDDVYKLLKQHRFMSVEDICSALGTNRTQTLPGIGGVLKRGEGYVDANDGLVRFRRLCSEPIPKELYQTTEVERKVRKLMAKGMDDFSVSMSENGEYAFKNKYDKEKTELIIDEDGQVSKLKCSCSGFNRGPRNISAPCPHLLALYMRSTKFTGLELKRYKEYKTDDIMEFLL